MLFCEQLARGALNGLPVTFHRVPFGDIWLRDTAPIFVERPEGLATVRFSFNGWGGKYVLDGDDQVAAQVAAKAGVPCAAVHILEGQPWEGILKAAKKHKCDAIVMASHGRRGLAGVLLGSETVKVLTHSKIPVLVYR